MNGWRLQLAVRDPIPVCSLSCYRIVSPIPKTPRTPRGHPPAPPISVTFEVAFLSGGCASVAVFGRVVAVDVRDVDRYGRLVGRVVYEGQDLSLALIRQGLAWHYKEYSSDQLLADAEDQARASRLGIWSQPDPIPPWEFRRAGRAPDPSSQGPFHGNRRSRVFHRPGCPNYNCRNCTENFRTREEAVEAGFRPAGDCH